MIVIYTFFVATMLVTGQALWKSAAMALTPGMPFSINNYLIKVLLTPKFIIGGIIYVFATLVYVWLFSKFPYYQVQLTLVTLSLILSVGVATLLFKEQLSPVNYIGIFILIIGVFLITRKG